MIWHESYDGGVFRLEIGYEASVPSKPFDLKATQLWNNLGSVKMRYKTILEEQNIFFKNAKLCGKFLEVQTNFDQPSCTSSATSTWEDFRYSMAIVRP